MDLATDADWDRLCANLADLVMQAMDPNTLPPQRAPQPRRIPSPYLNGDPGDWRQVSEFDAAIAARPPGPSRPAIGDGSLTLGGEFFDADRCQLVFGGRGLVVAACPSNRVDKFLGTVEGCESLAALQVFSETNQ